MSRNGPAQQIWTVNIITVWGGEELIMRREADARRYHADPDAYAAAHFGLSKIEYYQWLDTEGSPLCGHRTASGDECRARTGGYQLTPHHWQSLHRKKLCGAHARKARKK
jgi:hypothetical protein